MRRLALLLFFLSGACGLVYQVVWTRMMTHVFGTTAVAVGTVLAAFMCGLAAGSWLLGKVADRSRNPLRLYALLEFGVGLAALAAHLLLDRITPAYLTAYELFGRSDVALGTTRFVLAFVLVMAPTMLMGATLPVLTRFVVTRLSNVGVGLSALYAINTFGAVVGTLAAGFHLIAAYGLHRTVHIAVAGNLAIGAIAWFASSRAAVSSSASSQERVAPASGPTGQDEPLTPGLARLVLLGLVLSGFTSFAYEIYWTRSLVFLLGNSTYAVTSMLASFLTGIALGGFLVRFVVDRIRSRAALFGWIQILIGVTSAAALPVLFAVSDPQTIQVYMGEIARHTGQLLAVRFGVAFLVMLVPATLIGTTFPLVGSIGVSNLRRTGSIVGGIYAINTMGNVAGALLPGLVLLAWLGIQRGILAMAALNVLVGVVVLLAQVRRQSWLRWALPVALGAVALVLGRTPLDFQFPSEGQATWHRVLYYREGPSATTKVLLEPDTREKSMGVDGISIGGNTFTEFKQLLLAHLPKLLVDDVSVELSIGLGSGMLVGESSLHDRVRRIVCAEIEPSVVEGAAYFEELNHGVLDNPRLELVVDDVANHLRTTRDLYQVISADEKTSQEYASNGFSYSTEYYDLLRSRLAQGGIVVQWVPTTLPPDSYRLVLRTFATTFPHVQLWHFQPAYQEGAVNTILVGSSERVAIDVASVRRRLSTDPTAYRSLARYGLTSAEAVLVHFVAEDEVLRRAVAGAHVNSLVHPHYEFYSPREYAVPRTARLLVNHDLIVAMRREATPAFLAALVAGGEGDADRLEATFRAQELFLDGVRAGLTVAADVVVQRALNSALSTAPWNDSLRAEVFVQAWLLSSKYSDRGDYQRAAELMGGALEIYGARPLAHVNYSLVLRNLGQHQPAIEAARTAVELDPQLVAARRTLAQLLYGVGRTQEAAEQLRALLEVEPGDLQAKQVLSRLR